MWTGSHNLSELSSPSIRCSFIGLKQRKWRKARHVSHGMKGCFWLVQITFFIDNSWREEKALKGSVSCTHHVDNLLCPWLSTTSPLHIVWRHIVMQLLYHFQNCIVKISLSPKFWKYHTILIRRYALWIVFNLLLNLRSLDSIFAILRTYL